MYIPLYNNNLSIRTDRCKKKFYFEILLAIERKKKSSKGYMYTHYFNYFTNTVFEL